MNICRRAAAAGFILALWLGLPGQSEAGLLKSQRAQVAVFIQVTVIPGPFGGVDVPRQPGFDFAKLGKGSAPLFDATPLAGSVLIAANQGATAVQANVLANPTGTLLTASTSSISMTQGRGTTQQYSCPFSISINTTVTSWNLNAALTNDFITSTFPGNDLAYNMYIGAPPTPENYTAFVVLPNNNNTAALAVASGGSATYCVDLQLTIPQSVPLDTYDTNAVYTLLY